MTLKGLLSLMSSHKRSESPEQGLPISRRLKELLASTENPAVEHKWSG